MSTGVRRPVTHHPAEDVLWDYHRGRLTPGRALTVAVHLDLCPHCRSQLRLFDSIGGAFLEEIEGVELSDNALDLALARIERPETVTVPQAARHPAFLDGFALPDSLKTAVITGRYWAAPGVWMAPVHLDGAPLSDKTFLMSVKAGMVMPEHTHRGIETTIVLKGRFSDVFGEHQVGDYTSCDESHRHSPSIAEDGDCLCLVWQDAAIRPLTLLGKLLQPLARI